MPFFEWACTDSFKLSFDFFALLKQIIYFLLFGESINQHTLLLLLLFITFMHCIYNYISEKISLGYIVLQLFCFFNLWYM
jgi:hypothetical protein